MDLQFVNMNNHLSNELARLLGSLHSEEKDGSKNLHICSTESNSKLTADLQATLQTVDYCEKAVKENWDEYFAQKRGKEALEKELKQLQDDLEKEHQLTLKRKETCHREKRRTSDIIAKGFKMPLSVKTLLKQHARQTIECEDLNLNVSMEISNKENILNEKQKDEKETIAKERDIKAKQRFDNALRKDRQKQQYDETLKLLENAERFKRQQHAQQVSSNKQTWYPCTQADKFEQREKQARMEQAVENVTSKSKEHVIEDLDGYHDHLESKFKNREFNLSPKEEKLVECIPKFIQKNYKYLLQEEKFDYEFGKNISDLNESMDDPLNMAYIESPPADNIGTTSDDLDLDGVLAKLKEQRSRLLTHYEEELTHQFDDAASPKEQVDKAIETDVQSSEDKAIETDPLLQPKEKTLSLSRSIQVDLSNAGFLGHKAKSSKTKCLPSLKFDGIEWQTTVQHEDDARELNQSVSENGAWSSSSYCSLPSKHGIPKLRGQTNNRRCDICESEKEKLTQHGILVENHATSYQDHTMSNKTNDQKEKTVSSIMNNATHPKVSDYIRSVAAKYFPINAMKTAVSTPNLAVCAIPLSEPIRTRPFSMEAAQIENIETNMEFDKPISPEKHFGRIEDNKKQFINQPVSSSFEEKIPSTLTQPLSLSCPEVTSIANKSEKEMSTKMKIMHQVISNYLPIISVAPDKSSVENPEDSISYEEDYSQDEIDYLNVPDDPYVYHDLSTIQEMDSALTSGTPHPSILEDKSVLDKMLPVKKSSHETREETLPKRLDLPLASLIDSPPCSSIELAKNIKFISDKPEVSSQEETRPHSPNKNEIRPFPRWFVTPPDESLKQHTIESQNYIQPISSKQPSTNKIVTDLESSPESLKQFTIHSSELNQSAVSSDVPTSSTNLYQDKIKTKSSPDVSISDTLEQFTIESLKFEHSPVSNYKPVLSSKPQFSEKFESGSIPHSLASSESLTQYTIQSSMSSGMSTPNHAVIPSSQVFPPKEIKTNSAPCLGESFSSPESLVQYTIQSSLNSDSANIPQTFPKDTKLLPIYSRDFSDIESKKEQNAAINLPSSNRGFQSHTSIGTELNNVQREREKTHLKKLCSDLQVSEENSSGIFKPMTLAEFSSDSSNEHYSNLERNIIPVNDPINFEYDSSHGETHWTALTPHSSISEPFSTISGSVVQDNSNNSVEGKKQGISLMPGIENFTVQSTNSSSSPEQVSEFTQNDNASKEKYKNTQVLHQHKNGLILTEAKSLDQFNSYSTSNASSSDHVRGSKYGVTHDQIHWTALTPRSTDFTMTSSTSNEQTSSTLKSKSENLEQFSLPTSSSGAIPKPLRLLPADAKFEKEAEMRSITPINHSSSESLSDMITGLKSAFQSTPIKTAEEIAQETGIMEEPDLTLISSEMSSTVNSPEKFRNQTASDTASKQDETLTTTMPDLENALRLSKEYRSIRNEFSEALPSMEFISPSQYLDSKIHVEEAASQSMISFLRHEISCMAESTAADSLQDHNCNQPLTIHPFESKCVSENLPPITSESQVKNGSDFKIRTKRLWDNLEEVKQRKLADDRKKQITQSRERMKEFNKKLSKKRLATPKK